MKTKKFSSLLIGLVMTTFMLQSCQKNIPPDPVDYRLKYLGVFRFETVKEIWVIDMDTVFDTTFYNGRITNFEWVDRFNDLFVLNDDLKEDGTQKITVDFGINNKITTILNLNGEFTPRYAPHYQCFGGFVNKDSIVFYVDGLGGRGFGQNLTVKGKRLE